MKRVKYLNNRDLMAQIHASKNTYCSYVDTEDSQYDLIVPNLKKTILATGGAGQLFRESTNPAGASGDGIALA